MLSTSIQKSFFLFDNQSTAASFCQTETSKCANLQISPLAEFQLPSRSSFCGIKIFPIVNQNKEVKFASFKVNAILDVPEGQGASTEKKNEGNLPPLSIAGINGGYESATGYVSSEKWIFEKVVKDVSDGLGEPNLMLRDLNPGKGTMCTKELLEDAYARCGEVCAEYAKTFFLGTKLMTPERQRAIWAIYVWCRRTDELVDGPNAARITPRALDRWEERLEDIFNGEPYDMLDAALTHTVTQFPVKLQPFRDMVEGMRMDLRKSRYANFDELYIYCYNVAGTVGLMSVPVMGIDPLSKSSPESVYSAALALGIANQLTNILRDVGED